MKYKLNAYFAMLMVTIIGAGATLLIIHIAYANEFDITYASGATAYDRLQN